VVRLLLHTYLIQFIERKNARRFLAAAFNYLFFKHLRSTTAEQKVAIPCQQSRFAEVMPRWPAGELENPHGSLNAGPFFTGHAERSLPLGSSRQQQRTYASATS